MVNLFKSTSIILLTTPVNLQINLLGIGHNELGSLSDSFLYPERDDRMGLGGVGAYGQDTGGISYFIYGIGHGSASQ